MSECRGMWFLVPERGGKLSEGSSGEGPEFCRVMKCGAERRKVQEYFGIWLELVGGSM